MRLRSCGLTAFLRAHRAAGRNPLGFSLHPLPAAFRPPLAGCAVEATLRGRTGSAFCGTILVWPSGEIGRHSRLKICRGQPHVGSSPTSATIYISHSEIFFSRIYWNHPRPVRYLIAESSFVASLTYVGSMDEVTGRGGKGTTNEGSCWV